MAYTAWSVVFGEQPTAAKWNQLGTNDAGFKDGTNFDNDLIKSKHIDWAATGGGDSGGIWFEELGRSELSVAASTITASGLAARKFLRVYFYYHATGAINAALIFNNDNTGTYSVRVGANHASPGGTITSTQGFALETSSLPSGGALFGHMDIINISSREKLVIGNIIRADATGAANTIDNWYVTGKWANSASQITRVDLVDTDTGNFTAGSLLVVVGHD